MQQSKRRRIPHFPSHGVAREEKKRGIKLATLVCNAEMRDVWKKRVVVWREREGKEKMGNSSPCAHQGAHVR